LATLEVPQMEDAGLEMTMTFVDGDGVMLPPPDKMNLGDTWDLTMQMEFTMPEMMNAEGTMVVNDFYTILNHNPLDVLGQEFDGIQFQREFNTEINLNLAGVNTSFPSEFVDFQTITSMAKGVGFVTLDSQGDFGDTGLQLISYNIP